MAWYKNCVEKVVISNLYNHSQGQLFCVVDVKHYFNWRVNKNLPAFQDGIDFFEETSISFFNFSSRHLAFPKVSAFRHTLPAKRTRTWQPTFYSRRTLTTISHKVDLLPSMSCCVAHENWKVSKVTCTIYAGGHCASARWNTKLGLSPAPSANYYIWF